MASSVAPNEGRAVSYCGASVSKCSFHFAVYTTGNHPLLCWAVATTFLLCVLQVTSVPWTLVTVTKNAFFANEWREIAQVEVFFTRTAHIPHTHFHTYIPVYSHDCSSPTHPHTHPLTLTSRSSYTSPSHSLVWRRGRCQVHEVDGTSSINHYLDMDNTFFYCLGYTPETRWAG